MSSLFPAASSLKQPLNAGFYRFFDDLNFHINNSVHVHMPFEHIIAEQECQIQRSEIYLLSKTGASGPDQREEAVPFT